jgi:hypothetical protein
VKSTTPILKTHPSTQPRKAGPCGSLLLWTAGLIFAAVQTATAAPTIITFNADGNWTVPAGVTSVDYLVVGGGGGGGGQNGGGGGAGELLEGNLAVTSGEEFTITIGAAGAVNGNNRGSNGGASSLVSTSNNVTANGGGGGGAIDNTGLGNGGAGTGSAGGNGFVSTTEIHPAVAGGNGGSGGLYGGGDIAAGGGGGAGGNGADGVFDGVSGGNGGVGLSSSISGVLTFYAGGGGGATHPTNQPGTGLGGMGGGGNGGLGWSNDPANLATVGTPNTGGGGGGADDDPGMGGSGVVIVSYEAGGAAVDLKITSITSLGGGNFELTLKGEPSTSYEFYSSATLDFTSGTLVAPLTVTLGTGGPLDVTTDGSGDATVEASLGDLATVPANFVRAVKGL